MSISALNWAFEQDLPHAEKSVLVALAHRADKDGYCYPGIELISSMTGASRRTVIRSLNALDEKNLIERLRRHRSNGSRTSTSYTLNLSATVTHGQSDTLTPGGHEPKCHHGTPVSATVTPPPDKSVLISQIVPTEHEEKTGTMIEKPKPPTAQTLIAEWIDGMNQKPPGRVIGHLSKEIKNLLDEGYEYEQVRQATILWSQKNLSPGTLPSFLNQVINQPQSTTEDITSRAQRLQALYDQQRMQA